jgi:hypothetical protein
MKRLVNIFDLDCTLIDSIHRINEFGDVSLGFDYDHWLNVTREQIMKDSLLPLVEIFYEFKKTEFTNISITARTMRELDYEFLEKHNLHFDMILHRGDSDEPDHILKENKLKELFKNNDYIPFLAFDDRTSNIIMFEQFGFKCFDALEFNKRLNGKTVSFAEFRMIKRKRKERE